MDSRFEVVDGLELPLKWRELLRPGEPVGEEANSPALPRFFYRVPSWEMAQQFKLTVHFTLSELMSVDCREAPRLLHEFPHYVPCAVSVLARYLEEFRMRAEAPVFVAVNGGYRSPAHAFSQHSSSHLWATAANIYRIGDTLLDNERAIEKYTRIAETIGQEVYVKPFGSELGQTDDHLHFDIGCLLWAPRVGA